MYRKDERMNVSEGALVDVAAATAAAFDAVRQVVAARARMVAAGAVYTAAMFSAAEAANRAGDGYVQPAAFEEAFRGAGFRGGGVVEAW